MRIQPEVSTVAEASTVLAIAVVPVATLTLPSADATTTSTASATTTTTTTRIQRSLTTANMKKKRATNNVLKTLAIVTVAFVVCWIPNKCYSFLYLIGVTSKFQHRSGLLRHVRSGTVQQLCQPGNLYY